MQQNNASIESAEKYKILVENSSDCICLIDKNFNILFMGHGGLELNGFTSPEDPIGRSAIEGIATKDQPAMTGALENALHGNVTMLQYRSTNSAGQALWWESVVSPVNGSDGTVVNLMRISRDITQRKKDEQALIQAKEDAEQAKLLIIEIVGGLSHDLGNILSATNSVYEVTRILQMIKEKTLAPDLEDDINTGMALLACMGEASKRMGAIQRQLSLLRRKMALSGQAERLRPDFVNIYAVTESIFKIFQKSVEEKKIELISEIQPKTKIFADFYSVISLMQNLIHNAIKFSSSGGKIRIFMPDSETIAVSDTGVGMSKEKLSAIFKEKKRVSSEGTSGETGTGMGTHTIQRIMEAHGGSLNVESTEGNGSAFYLNFPQHPEL